MRRRRQVNTAHGGPPALSGGKSRIGFIEKECQFLEINTDIPLLHLDGNSWLLLHESDRERRLANRALMEELLISAGGNTSRWNPMNWERGEGWRYLGGASLNLLDDRIQWANIREFARAVVVRILINR